MRLRLQTSFGIRWSARTKLQNIRALRFKHRATHFPPNFLLISPQMATYASFNRHLFAFLLSIFATTAFSITSTHLLRSGDAPTAVEFSKRFLTSDSIGEIDRVDPTTGDLTISQRDVHIPGNGHMDIEIYRNYGTSDTRGAGTDDRAVIGSIWEPNKIPETPYVGWGWTVNFMPKVRLEVTRYAPSSGGIYGDGQLCGGGVFTSNNYDATPFLVYTIEHPNGATEKLVPTANGVVSSQSGWQMTCAGGLRMLFSPNGIRYDLAAPVQYIKYQHMYESMQIYSAAILRATKATDRNGNWLAATYEQRTVSTAFTLEESVPYLTAVSSSDGRSLSLEYSSRSLPLLTKISGPDGAEWKYSYEIGTDIGYPTASLTSVELPDHRFWSYSYWGLYTNPEWWLPTNSRFGLVSARSKRLRQMTYPEGGTISYDYQHSERWAVTSWWWDCETAEAVCWPTDDTNWLEDHISENIQVTRRESSDGGIWSYSYNPTRVQGGYDKTVVTAPDGVTTYSFIGQGYYVPGGMTGDPYWVMVNQVAQGAWKMGLLMEKEVGSNYKEVYEYSPRIISSFWGNYITARVGVYEWQTMAPDMVRKTITLDGSSYVTEYSNYDAYGNPGTIIEHGPNGGDRTTVFSYYNNPDKHILGEPNGSGTTGGHVVTKERYANGNIKSISKDGVTTQYTYTSEGDIASITDARGKITGFSDYKRGQARFEQKPENVTIAREVSDAGRVLSIRDGKGDTTVYEWDTGGRIKKTIPPVGNPTTVDYGTASYTLTRGTWVQVVSLDGFGRSIATNTSGIVVNRTYDPLGQKKFESYPGSPFGTSYIYDQLGRLKKTTNGDGTYQLFDYLAGAKIRQTNERSNSTLITYRAFGKPEDKAVITIEPALVEGRVDISRNGVGQILSVSQGGRTRSYGYDPHYYLTSVVDPESGTTLYGRDALGNITSRQVAVSGVTGYAYDGLNRQTDIFYPAGTSNVTKTYYGDGLVKKISNGVAELTYLYDGNKNLLQEEVFIGAKRYLFSYSYTGNDSLDGMKYPSGLGLTYAPDQLGRPTQVFPFITSVVYHSNNQPSLISYANGVTTAIDLLATRQWPRHLTASKVGAGNVMDLTYDYDGTANVNSIVNAVDAANSVISTTYDAMDRLTAANTNTSTAGFNYDGGGNILSRNVGANSYAYAYEAGSNRLSAISGAKNYSFSYDQYGNVTSNGSNQFIYNDASQLVSVVGGATHAYDGNSMRVTTDAAGKKIYHVYSRGGDLLMEEIQLVSGRSESVKEYVYFNGKQIAVREDDDPKVVSGIGLAVSPASPAPGQPVTITANVAGYSPVGSVVFYDNGASLGTAALTGGGATVIVYTLPPGVHILTVKYAGDVNNTPSDSLAVNISIAKSSPVLTLTSSAAGLINKGQGITLTASLYGAFNPTGNISFLANGQSLGASAITGSLAQLSSNQLPIGTTSVAASYPGDNSNQPATTTAPLTINVVKASSTTVLNANADGVLRKGAVLTVTASVIGYEPSGSVLFKMDGTAQGVPITLVNGVATLSLNSLLPGQHVISAEYSGDSQNEISIGTFTLKVVVPGALLIPIQMMLED